MFACLPVCVEASCSFTGQVSSVLRRSLTPRPCWLWFLSGMGSAFLVMLHLVGHECSRANQTVLSPVCSPCPPSFMARTSNPAREPRGRNVPPTGMARYWIIRKLSSALLDGIKTATWAPCQAQFMDVSPHATLFENRERAIAEVLTDRQHRDRTFSGHSGRMRPASPAAGALGLRFCPSRM